MTYDGLERLITQTNPLGQETIFTYDNNGNKIKKSWDKSSKFKNMLTSIVLLYTMIQIYKIQ